MLCRPPVSTRRLWTFEKGRQTETKLATHGCITILHPHWDFIHKLFTAIDQNIIFFSFILTLCTVLMEQSSRLLSADRGGSEQRVYMTTSSKGNKNLSSRFDSDATTAAACRPALHCGAAFFSSLASSSCTSSLGNWGLTCFSTAEKNRGMKMKKEESDKVWTSCSLLVNFLLVFLLYIHGYFAQHGLKNILINVRNWQKTKKV